MSGLPETAAQASGRDSGHPALARVLSPGMQSSLLCRPHSLGETEDGSGGQGCFGSLRTKRSLM
jgi:hypothetical protein